jgi:6-pyruvoyltetrahydropterin/6-carboxytetrahydropterin synthase
MRLMREIRFSVGPEPAGPVLNSWAGWPSPQGIVPYIVLRARIEGEPHGITGYICNISQMDRLLRERVIPLCNAFGRGSANSAQLPATPERLIQSIGVALGPHAPAGTRWVDWELRLTPYLGYTLVSGESPMVLMTEAFEFSAAHRLHCPTISDEENRRTFGKCNNANGHGHNYQVDITIAGEPDPLTGVLLPAARLERTVRERVIDRLDHKHLNVDCDEFRNLNPSVENIARVIWSLLDRQFEPARLAHVRVWETPKTYAECSA